MLKNIKAKLPSKKKGNEDEVDENEDLVNETEDKTDPNLNLSDKTGATDIGGLDNSDDNEEVEEDAESGSKTQTLIDKIKAKIIPRKNSKDESDPKTAKKKINPVVLVVVVVALGVFLFYEEEPEPVAVPVTPRKSLRKTPKPEEIKTEAPAETPTEVPAETPTEVPAETPTEVPSETPTEVSPSEPEPVSTDSVDGQVTDTDTEESTMTDKILEDLEKQVKKDEPKEVKKEYVAPPDYEYKGRGLVYNCVGKHWACVDGPSYKTCEDNFSSTTFKKKNIECYPFNVYESTKGCELMQNRVVSSNAKTNFCK